MTVKTYKVHQMVSGPFRDGKYGFPYAVVKAEDEDGNFFQDELYAEDYEDLVEMKLHLISKFDPFIFEVEEGSEGGEDYGEYGAN